MCHVVFLIKKKPIFLPPWYVHICKLNVHICLRSSYYMAELCFLSPRFYAKKINDSYAALFDNFKLCKTAPGLCKWSKNINKLCKFCIKSKKIALKCSNNFEKLCMMHKLRGQNFLLLCRSCFRNNLIF